MNCLNPNAILAAIVFFICAIGLTANAQTKDVQKPQSKPTPSPVPIVSPKPVPTPETENRSRPVKDMKRKIIVVLDFDNVSPQCRDEIYGKNVATQLSTAFSLTGNYTVIEKQRIDKIFDEQNISQGDRFKPESAAIVGNIVSASTVVLGTITQCSPETKQFNAWIGQSVRHTVNVGLAIRLVDINSAEIQEAITISESDTDTSVRIKGVGVDTAITPDLQIKLFNKAVAKAVKKAVRELESIIVGEKKPVSSERIATTPGVAEKTTVPVTTPAPTMKLIPGKTAAKIVAISGDTIYVTGLGNSAKIGDVLSILRGKEIKNVETGEFLDYDGKEIAKAEVFEINEGTIKAKLISGTGVKELDFVKLLK